MRRLIQLLFFISLIILFNNCSNEPPTATISSPGNGERFIEGHAIDFTGRCEDPEDGSLKGNSIVWTSNVDGRIGVGSSFLCNFLSASIHEITMKATDSDGNIDKDNVTIEVLSYDREMVEVPATSGFLMGWIGKEPDEEPVHTVYLNSFEIGKYEVTYGLWMKVKTWAEANGYAFRSSGHMGWDENGTTDEHHPVVLVFWIDCIIWCNAYSEMEGLTPIYGYIYTYEGSRPQEQWKVYRVHTYWPTIVPRWNADGYRLPTEAEWEYAARYIDGTNYTPGDEHSGYNIDELVYQCAWTDGATHPVGEKLANSLGVHDMTGNVWEWCWDWYGPYSSEPQDNPHGPETGEAHVLRGGTGFDYTAERRWCQTSSGSSAYGFRVCRNKSTL